MKRLINLVLLVLTISLTADAQYLPSVLNDEMLNLRPIGVGQAGMDLTGTVQLIGADSLEVFALMDGTVSVSDTLKIAVSGQTPVRLPVQVSLGSHEYRLRAIYSDASNGIFLEDDMSSIPVNKTLNAPSVDSVTTNSATTTNSLTVDIVVNTGSLEADCEVCIRESGTSTFSGCQSKATINGATNATFTGLSDSTEYEIRLRPSNLLGSGTQTVTQHWTRNVFSAVPTGQLINSSFTESEAMVTVDIDPQGLYPGSETTIWAEWVPLNSSVTKLSQQISVTNQQSINLTIFNLLGDQPGELKVYAENAAGTLTVATVSGRTDFPQRQNIILSSLTIDSDGVVTVVVEADGNGLESELSIDFFRNGDRVSSFDTILGSSGSNVVVQFQANECDTISVDAYLYTTLFGDEIAENNRAKVYAFCPKDVVNSISETTKKRYTGMADVYTLMGQYIGEVKIINGNRERTNFNIAPGAYIYKTPVEQYGEKFYINR